MLAFYDGLTPPQQEQQAAKEPEPVEDKPKEPNVDQTHDNSKPESDGNQEEDQEGDEDEEEDDEEEEEEEPGKAYVVEMVKIHDLKSSWAAHVITFCFCVCCIAVKIFFYSMN